MVPAPQLPFLAPALFCAGCVLEAGAPCTKLVSFLLSWAFCSRVGMRWHHRGRRSA